MVSKRKHRIRQDSLSIIAHRVRKRLQHSQRTIFKHRVEIIRSRSSPVLSLFQPPCSGPGESDEGCIPLLASYPLDRQVPGVRKESFEDMHRKSNKKTRKESSNSSPGGTEESENLERVGKGPSSDNNAGASKNLNNSVKNRSAEKDSEVNGEEKYKINNTEFHQKYEILGDLKKGGYAVIYRGISKKDNLPIAIKRVSKCFVSWMKMNLDGEWTLVPHEVALLLRVGAGLGTEHSNVAPVLLDWYNLQREIIMVIERPEPCMDLVDYINSLGESINEHEVKVIFRQLVDAAIKMLALGIFHRDIKPDNVLVETGQPIPRARFIDFGCGTTCASSQVFNMAQGTDIYSSPEYYSTRRYMAGPTTVWQLGLTLYVMLHRRFAFASVDTLCSSLLPPIKAEISDDCKDFLRRLMDKNPETRMSIEKIKDHPWMN